MAGKWPENGQEIPGIPGSLKCVMGSAGFEHEPEKWPAGHNQITCVIAVQSSEARSRASFYDVTDHSPDGCASLYSPPASAHHIPPSASKSGSGPPLPFQPVVASLIRRQKIR